MKKSLTLYTLALILCISPGCDFFDKNSKNPIVLQIENSQWTRLEFAKLLSTKINPFTTENIRNSLYIRQIKHQLINDLIYHEIITKWAQQNNIVVEDNELKSEIKKIKKSFPSTDIFHSYLKKNNLTDSEWSTRIKDRLLNIKVTESIFKNLTPPSEGEVKAYYQNHISEFKTKKRASIEHIFHKDRHRITTLHNRIKKGEDFTQLAFRYSQGPNPGLPFWIEEGTLEVFNKAFVMQASQVSDILHSPYGFHMLRLTKIEKSRTKSFSEVKPFIAQSMMEKKKKAYFVQWLERQSASIQVVKNQVLLEKITPKHLHLKTR